MVLGQSAATVAAHALDEGADVQAVDPGRLRDRLLADRQILTLGPQVQGLVVDDAEAAVTGTWIAGSLGGKVGSGYRHDGDTAKGSAAAEFTRALAAGRYEVVFYFEPHANRATNVPVRVIHAAGETQVLVNERAEAGEVSLGTFDFGTQGRVRVSNAGTDGYVVIDGASFIKR